ncbi:hypothetical protein DMA11_04040 [Marinilabiliaceae bacterium JC017]|nr:hypothetical protein DMA11_04040 [Marinilabiliaceae bacterium JC017]
MFVHRSQKDIATFLEPFGSKRIPAILSPGYEPGLDDPKRASPLNKRAGAGATKMNAGILACGLEKIHRGGGLKLLFD